MIDFNTHTIIQSDEFHQVHFVSGVCQRADEYQRGEHNPDYAARKGTADGGGAHTLLNRHTNY